MNKRRVVVTGMGVIACNGEGVEAFWRANAEGKSGVSRIDTFDTKEFEPKVAGIVRGFDPAAYMPPATAVRVDRFVHFGLACADMALKQSRLELAGRDTSRIGVIIGSGIGGALFHEEQMVAAYAKGLDRVNPASVPKITPNAVASHIAIRYGIRGQNMVISTACASGANGIGEAFRKIQYGELDACLTGGVEAPLSRFNFAAYCALRVLSKRSDDPTKASRPFEASRDGFVMGEGGAILVLEDRERAIERGATILAEITGYCCNSGAHHMVMPAPEGDDAARVMAAAIQDAGGVQIDYINAHATSTRANDAAETRAIKAVFGETARTLPISSTKSMIGHAIGAAGAIEAVVCVKALMEQFIPPTINLDAADPECDLNYVPHTGIKAELNSVLSNSFGFGNCNVALVFKRADPS